MASPFQGTGTCTVPCEATGMKFIESVFHLPEMLAASGAAILIVFACIALSAWAFFTQKRAFSLPYAAVMTITAVVVLGAVL